jgi:hypothetical protein
MEFRNGFASTVVCQNVTIKFAVDDPLIFATKEVSFTLDDFPPILSVPTAAGYEVRVTCTDGTADGDGNGVGVVTLMEVSCPGLESQTDVCVHRLLADVSSIRALPQKRPAKVLGRTARHDPVTLIGNAFFESFEHMFCCGFRAFTGSDTYMGSASLQSLEGPLIE